MFDDPRKSLKTSTSKPAGGAVERWVVLPHGGHNQHSRGLTGASIEVRPTKSRKKGGQASNGTQKKERGQQTTQACSPVGSGAFHRK